MSESLRDQLIRAGLVTEQQARAANAPRRAPQLSRKKSPPLSANQQAVQRAQAAKAAQDQELNRRQQEKAERKARRAAVRQIVEQCRLPAIEGDDFYNFIDNGRIKRIAVTPPVRAQLGRGELVIVRYGQHHALVSLADSARIRERDADAIVPPAAVAPAADDSAYKEYAVPDDLMW